MTQRTARSLEKITCRYPMVCDARSWGCGPRSPIPDPTLLILTWASIAKWTAVNAVELYLCYLRIGSYTCTRIQREPGEPRAKDNSRQEPKKMGSCSRARNAPRAKWELYTLVYAFRGPWLDDTNASVIIFFWQKNLAGFHPLKYTVWKARSRIVTS